MSSTMNHPRDCPRAENGLVSDHDQAGIKDTRQPTASSTGLGSAEEPDNGRVATRSWLGWGARQCSPHRYA